MKSPHVLLRELTDRVRRDFYSGAQAKYWFGQQKMVKRALLYPARWLKDKEVEIPAARYEEIVVGILETARKHGDLARITYMSRYLLHCTQEHMRHHGDDYYREGVNIRNRVTLIMNTVEKARRGADSTVPILAQAEELLQIGKRKAAIKPPTPTLQPDLFGGSKPRRVANSN